VFVLELALIFRNKTEAKNLCRGSIKFSNFLVTIYARKRFQKFWKKSVTYLEILGPRRVTWNTLCTQNLPLWNGLRNVLLSGDFSLMYVKWCKNLFRERTIKITLNPLDAFDQATGFVHLCARHSVDFQAYDGTCICNKIQVPLFDGEESQWKDSYCIRTKTFWKHKR
jgi:hypothetical protein